jgi:hypothetical protein
VVDQEVTVGKAAADEQVATVDPAAAAADQETAMDQSAACREETAVNEQLDETASKLLASGISISLIKKKKAHETAEGDPPENNVTADGSCPSAESAAKPPVTNALEVGPNISVTMVNRSEAAPSRFTLSLKSQSELLMDPRGRSEDATGGGKSAAGMADTLTVSRVVSRSPSQQQQQQFPSKSTAKSPMLGAHALMSPPLSRPGSIGSSPPIAGGGGSGFRHNGGALRSGGGGAVTEQLNAVAAGIADYMVRYYGHISYFHVYNS